VLNIEPNLTHNDCISSYSGIIYPFFAVLGLIGMFTSTKIHTEGGIDDTASEVDAAQQKSSPKEESEEVVEKEIV